MKRMETSKIHTPENFQKTMCNENISSVRYPEYTFNDENSSNDSTTISCRPCADFHEKCPHMHEHCTIATIGVALPIWRIKI